MQIFWGGVELKGYMSKCMVSKKYAQMKLMAWILIKYWEKPAAVCWCFRQTWVKAVASCSPSQMTVRSSVPAAQSWFIELFLPILSAWLVSHGRRAVLYVTLDAQHSRHPCNLLLWHLFQLFSLICLLCAKPSCTSFPPEAMRSILRNQKGLVILKH